VTQSIPINQSNLPFAGKESNDRSLSYLIIIVVIALAASRRSVSSSVRSWRNTRYYRNHYAYDDGEVTKCDTLTSPPSGSPLKERFTIST